MRAQDRARRAGTRPRSDHTLETALATMRDLALFLMNHRAKADWALVDVHDVEAFLVTLPNGRKRRLTVLRQFFTCYVIRRWEGSAGRGHRPGRRRSPPRGGRRDGGYRALLPRSERRGRLLHPLGPLQPGFLEWLSGWRCRRPCTSPGRCWVCRRLRARETTHGSDPFNGVWWADQSSFQARCSASPVSGVQMAEAGP
jgi:hypothetical protein